jgi:hypothetical protein
MMAFADSIASDLLVADDLRAVTFRHRTSGDDLSSVNVAHALRRAINRGKQVLLDLPLDRVACAWHLMASELGAVVPQIGDLVVSGADTWVVDSVEVVDEGRRYRLTCLLEVKPFNV